LRDGLLSGAVNTWAAGWTYGHVAFDNTAAQSADAVAAATQGNFSKWNLTLGRLQNLGTDDAVYLEASGQWANGNLDPSQQMIEGGPTSVRGYDVSTLAGDMGYQFSAELRHTFEGFWYGKWQAIAFADGAHLTVNKSAFAPGPNSASLGGAGVGLNWAGPDQWLAGLTIATPIGGRPELAGSEDSTRVWLQLSKAL
jgi:hemolysin activation/secretion protein